MKKTKLFKKLVHNLTDKSLNKSHKIQKYGAWGLLIFVAIPLPGTGVWSGSLAAALLDMRFKWAFPAILVGNLIAGILVMGLSHGVVGHKTADTSFFGYKTHLAMTEERIITAAAITSGEKHDGKQLKDLVEKSIKNRVEIEAIIGDSAYSEKDNIKYAREEKIKLISKLSPTVTHGCRKNDDKFEYNKDAGMYVCPAGHMSIKKTSTRPKKHAKDGEGTVESYFFDVEKCKHCSLKEGCYKEGAKTKSYSVSIKSVSHQEQMDFQETEYFKDKSKERYKIEAKNSELKHIHGLM